MPIEHLVAHCPPGLPAGIERVFDAEASPVGVRLYVRLIFSLDSPFPRRRNPCSSETLRHSAECTSCRRGRGSCWCQWRSRIRLGATRPARPTEQTPRRGLDWAHGALLTSHRLVKQHRRAAMTESERTERQTRVGRVRVRSRGMCHVIALWRRRLCSPSSPLSSSTTDFDHEQHLFNGLPVYLVGISYLYCS